MKNAVFWDVVPCGSSVNRRLQGIKIRERGIALAVG
jgi:hypothetical protein